MARANAGVVKRSYSGVVPEGNSISAAPIPTTCRATVGPDGATLAPLPSAGNCDDAYSGVRMTEPTCTPKSCWRVKEASTSYGDDSAGIWPATNFTTRLKAVGDSSLM